MLDEILRRRELVKSRIAELQGQLTRSASLVAGKACIYATGSFGRLEAGDESDLDLFIVGTETGNREEKNYKSALTNLNATIVKADLIQAIRSLNIKDFDGDGKYLAHFTDFELADSLGEPDDDYKNTLTSRLLLLLESTPLLGDEIYWKAVDEIIFKYWRDYEDHRDNFTPAFLGNDIIRLWRTFCVNYEARTERMPDEKKKKGKVKNYKLKHSRMLTCYSTLLCLLSIYGENNTVHPENLRHIIGLTPTRRLEWLGQQERIKNSHEILKKLLHLYNDFLVSTSNETELGERLMNPDTKKLYSESTYEFGNTLFEAMNIIGNGSRLHRLLVV